MTILKTTNNEDIILKKLTQIETMALVGDDNHERQVRGVRLHTHAYFPISLIRHTSTYVRMSVSVCMRVYMCVRMCVYMCVHACQCAHVCARVCLPLTSLSVVSVPHLSMPVGLSHFTVTRSTLSLNRLSSLLARLPVRAHLVGAPSLTLADGREPFTLTEALNRHSHSLACSSSSSSSLHHSLLRSSISCLFPSLSGRSLPVLR